jgi:hypothetical protein
VNDQIIELLENTELRQKVIAVIKEVWSYAGTLYDNPDEDMEEYIEKVKGASLWEEAWGGAERDIDKIQDAFDDYVIRKIAKPYRLTLEELVQAFLDLAKPDERHYTDFEQFTSDDCNNLYAIFVNYIKNHILSYRHSDPFPICLVAEDGVGKEWLRGAMSGYALAMTHVGRKDFPPSGASDTEDVEKEKPLWHKNGVSVSLLRGADLIEERPGGKKLYHILALIEGNTSVLACRDLQSEMARILPTAIRSADLLQTTGFRGEYKVVEPTIPRVFEREIKGLPWGEESLLENARPLISQYVDAYYSDFPGKKDSIDRRIRNAVSLLIESDNQPNNAVGLALSITGIEALLGEKGEGIAIMLAERVGALLEPDDIQRNNATEFVKKLYNTRSRALHGELVETESTVRFNARHLAAAALDAMIFLKLAAPSYYDVPDTPEQLLKFLYDSRRTHGQPLGIKEYNVRELWMDKTTGKKDSGL